MAPPVWKVITIPSSGSPPEKIKIYRRQLPPTDSTDLPSCHATWLKAAHNEAVYQATRAAIKRYDESKTNELTDEQKDTIAQIMSQELMGNHRPQSLKTLSDVRSRTWATYFEVVNKAADRAMKVLVAQQDGIHNGLDADADAAQDLAFILNNFE